MIAAARAGDYWRRLSFWELAELAEASLRRDSKDRAAILAVVWNVHAKKRSQVKAPQDFDPFEVMDKRESLKRLREKYAQVETLADFIKRNQGELKK